MLRSILSVLGGLIIMTAASFAIEFVVDAILLRAFPGSFADEAALMHSTGVMIFTMAYTLACMVLGGYLAATFAGRVFVAHAIALAVVQEILTVIAIVYKVAPAPAWAWALNLILVPICIILGGSWRAAKQTQRLAPS
ncbi:MAG: hypothetical protein WBE20_02865 [Candidatus Acidiferrales bacterium]